MTNFVRYVIIYALFILLNAAPAFAAESFSSERSAVTLESAVSQAQAGKQFLARLHFKLAEGWHIYWKNAGDSGLPVSTQWQLPEDWNAGEILWPTPERILIEGLMNYGYHQDVSLLIPITPPANLAEDETASLKLKANWLICKETCIPESATLDLELITAAQEKPSDIAEAIAIAAENLPSIAEQTGGLAESEASISLSWPVEISTVSEVYFYPETQWVIDHAAPQEWKLTDGKLSATLKKGTEKLGASLSGILQIDGKSWQVTFGEKQSPVASRQLPVVINHQPSTSFISAILFALLGGLLLNAMPCVFPVLSLKALAISKKAEAQPAQIRAQGIAYLLGCMVTFTALAGVLILLKQAGFGVGWGFQLQTPAFVAAMLFLFLLLGLNLAGLFEIPQFLANFGQEKANRDSTSGSFFTGMLAVLVATPCTVPFMTPALGYAFTQSPALTLLIMTAMGTGMAIPYLLISFVPAARALLPKPGLWMERFKQFMAFPMFGTGLWLLWVLMQQIETTSIATILALILWVAFLIWWMRGGTGLKQLLAVIVIAISLGYGISQMEIKPIEKSDIQSKIAALRAENKPVFLDATAAWCITCKVNENGVLKSEAVQKAFAENTVVTLVADWTNHDPDITALLESFNHQGVPLYVYYPPENAEPVVLPQILTEQVILDALK